MPQEDDRTPVEVVEEEPERAARVGTRDLLRAIQALPDAVAARLDGATQAHSSDEGGAPEVTFVGDEPLPTTADTSETAETASGTDPQPVAHPEPSRPRFRHPSARKRRAEAIA